MPYNKKLTNLTCSGSYWRILALGRCCARSVLPRTRANIPQYSPCARWFIFCKQQIYACWLPFFFAGGNSTFFLLFFFFLGRILAGCYWFCILIWVSTYTANLAAFFTVKNAEDPIGNLEDIVKSSYQVGVLDSSSTHAFFQSSTYYLHQKIWSRMERVKNAEEGVRWVREKDKFVFISDGPMLQYIANQPPCNLKVGKRHLSTPTRSVFVCTSRDTCSNFHKRFKACERMSMNILVFFSLIFSCKQYTRYVERYFLFSDKS